MGYVYDYCCPKADNEEIVLMAEKPAHLYINIGGQWKTIVHDGIRGILLYNMFSSLEVLST